MPIGRLSKAFQASAGAMGYYIDPLTGMVKPLPQTQQEQPVGQEQAVEQATSPLESIYNQGAVLNPALAGKEEQTIPKEQPLEPDNPITAFQPTTSRTREGMTSRGPGTGYGFTWGGTSFEMPEEQPEILNPDVGRPTMRGEVAPAEAVARTREGAVNVGRPGVREKPKAKRRAKETRASLFKRYENANAAALAALKSKTPLSNLLGYQGGIPQHKTLLGQ